MYAKKTQHTSVSNVEDDACLVVPTSSGVSFSIDRTGVRPSHIIFDQDQQQFSTESSDSVTVCDAAAAGGTCQTSPADDVILIEDSCEHNENLNTGTNTPEPSMVVSVNKDGSVHEKLMVSCTHFLLIIS